jgi:hypothetical protein
MREILEADNSKNPSRFFIWPVFVPQRSGALTDVLHADPRYPSAANGHWSLTSYSLDKRLPVIRVLMGISTL